MGSSKPHINAPPAPRDAIGRVGARVGRYPRLEAVVRPLWHRLRFVLTPRRARAYWQRRRHLGYYTEVVRLARAHVPEGGAVLDVGAGGTGVLGRLDWFEHRVALDRTWVVRGPGVVRVTADFMNYTPDRAFDLVLCLQVLEHLEEPGAFARKLLQTGSTVIVSVPYQWPAGRVHSHAQDPIDDAKLAGWLGRLPDDRQVIVDGSLARLITVYRVNTFKRQEPSQDTTGAPASQ